jgi:hypothetical protein
MGPYSISRNPLYVFSLSAFSASAPKRAAFCSAFADGGGLAIFLPVILAEERLLAGSSGAEYSDYRKRVPRFGPRISAWRTSIWRRPILAAWRGPLRDAPRPRPSRQRHRRLAGAADRRFADLFSGLPSSMRREAMVRNGHRIA